MSLRPLLRTLALPVFAAFMVLSVASMTACGTDVASCASVCTTSSCTASCNSQEQSCVSSKAESDFQLLLTCIANAPATYDTVPSLCQDALATVRSSCSFGFTPGH